jgi:hypothetical protein
MGDFAIISFGIILNFFSKEINIFEGIHQWLYLGHIDWICIGLDVNWVKLVLII